jgi:Ca-activated chloride channel homolog
MRYSCLLLISTSVCLFPANTAPQSQTYRYGVKVEMVDLYANVYNQKGKLMTGLSREDFVIYDQGVLQAITQFSREYIPLSVVVLLDTSGSMAGVKLDSARRSLLQFIKRLNRGDEVLLMTFQARPRITQTFTEDLDKVRNALRRIEANGSTALYDSIQQSLEVIEQSHNPRRALLLISDGINTFGKAALGDTINRLRRKGVELYAIGIESDSPEDSSESAITKAVLERLTNSAGGQAYIVADPEDLGKICRTISDQMHNQYSLGYYPPQTIDGEWRDIRIVTRVPGAVVIPSKTGYYSTSKQR